MLSSMPTGEAASSTEQALSPGEALRWTRLGALSALALLLGYLESFVPIPIPGVKLGLANIPVLVALAEGDLTGAFFIGLIKVTATALLFGNPLSLAYSATGTLLAFLLMAPLSRLKTMRLEMVSIVGALAHEAGQLIVAQWLLDTSLVWYGAPVLALAGCVTGLFCGIAARHVAERLATSDASTTDSPTAGEPMKVPGAPSHAPIVQEPATDTVAISTTSTDAATRDLWQSVREVSALVTFFALVVLFMRSQSVSTLLLCLVQAIGFCLLGQARRRTLLRALAPTLPMAIIALVAQVACNQQGEALAAIGPVVLTKAALTNAALMLIRLVGITCASVGLVAVAGRNGLARMGHACLRPLRRLGAHTAGPELAASCTLQLLPVLAARLQGSVKTTGSPLSPSFWTQELPEIAAELLATAQAEANED